MINVLRQFGNIPVTATTIGSLYPSLAEKNKKVRLLEKHDEIIWSNDYFLQLADMIKFEKNGEG